MIKFHLPGIIRHHKLNIALIELLKKHPEYFYDDIAITGVYGCFNPCLWNGGRRMNTNYLFDQERRDIIKQYNDLGVGILYTFTNMSLLPLDYSDFYCNQDILNIINGTDINKIIVADEKLKEYIQNHYSGYDIKFISSITSEFCSDLKVLASKEQEYDILMINYNLNNTEEIKSIKNKSKYEILVNPQCVKNCEFEHQHYKNISDLQACRTNESFECPYKANEVYDIQELLKLEKCITVEDLYGKYAKSGFEIFKINGRTTLAQYVLEYYLYYMVKPEYKEKVRELLAIF